MKILSLIVIAGVIASFVPATGYAIVDASVYGGYQYSGWYDSNWGSAKKDAKGMEYGFLCHVNFDLLWIFNFGIGAAVQKQNIKSKYYQVSYYSDIDIDNLLIGPDACLSVNFKAIPLRPYLRGGMAAYNRTTVHGHEDGGWDDHITASFKAYYFGIGTTFVVLPFLHVFGEYIYSHAKQVSDVEMSGNAVHLGVKLDI
jgi:hypothetical protein